MTQRSSDSIARQNYHTESEAGVNRQINQLLNAGYVYYSMCAHFNRDDIALYGIAKYFKRRRDDKQEDADKLIKYQNQRGGRVVLGDIKTPTSQEWGSGLEATSAALELEKNVNAGLLKLRAIASEKEDREMGNFLDGFLHEQAKLIRETADYLTNLKRVGPGLGEYQFDKLFV